MATLLKDGKNYLQRAEVGPEPNVGSRVINILYRRTSAFLCPYY